MPMLILGLVVTDGGAYTDEYRVVWNARNSRWIVDRRIICLDCHSEKYKKAELVN